MQKRRATASKETSVDKPILQRTATCGNRGRRIVAPKGAGPCHWTCHQTVAVAPLDTTLIPPGTQYGATLGKAQQRNPFRRGVIVTPCTPLRRAQANGLARLQEAGG